MFNWKKNWKFEFTEINGITQYTHYFLLVELRFKNDTAWSPIHNIFMIRNKIENHKKKNVNARGTPVENH